MKIEGMSATLTKLVVAPCLLFLFLGQAAAVQIPGWEASWPPPKKVFAGCDRKILEGFAEENAALIKNPRDEDALVNRAVYGLRLAKTSRYDMFLLWLAAKDLEKAVKLNPKDWQAWHNYGDVNYSAGDFWMTNDHSNGRRALDAFNHAIVLNPKSARSYMGRGWVYYTLNDVQHATADFRKAVQLDPSLKQDIQTEVGNIRRRKGEESAARGTVQQMSRYYINRNATTEKACQAAVCTWVKGECRCTAALNPGPRESRFNQASLRCEFRESLPSET